jgi:hypothetical protein
MAGQSSTGLSPSGPERLADPGAVSSRADSERPRKIACAPEGCLLSNRAPRVGSGSLAGSATDGSAYVWKDDG